MLELRSHCEGCAKPLPPTARDAMICTFECTFCEVCALQKLQNVCPNCGGNFAHRPIRPREKLVRCPATGDTPPFGVNTGSHQAFVDRYRDVAPEDR